MRRVSDEELQARAEALRKLHCIRCFDVVRGGPKVDPCTCDCHRERKRMEG